MRILYLAPNFVNHFIVSWHGMVQALSKYAEVKMYGPWYPEFHKLNPNWEPGLPQTADIFQVIRELYGDGKPDVILMRDPEGSGWAGEIPRMGEVQCLKVLWSVDIHKDAVPHRFELFNQMGIGLVLLSIDKELQTEGGGKWRSFGKPIEWYPMSVDPDYFRPLGIPKEYDVATCGSFASSHYPFRIFCHNAVLGCAGIRYFDPTKSEPVLFEEYVKLINKTKIFFTCTSTYHYPVLKFLEVMSCGTLLMADHPIDTGFMHLVPGWNYVEVSESNFVEKVGYYMAHDEEARQIGMNGRETVLKYHTHDIRAKEVVETISKYLVWFC